jgi:hypothetical protein
MYFVTTFGDIGIHSIIAGLVAFLAIQGFWFLFCKRPLKKLQHRMQETILLASFAFALLVQASVIFLKFPISPLLSWLASHWAPSHFLSSLHQLHPEFVIRPPPGESESPQSG